MAKTTRAAPSRLGFTEGRIWGAVVALTYAGLVLAPLAAVVVLRLHSGTGVALSAREVGRALALVGVGLLAMQFVLSARLHWLERPFGLDVVFRYHKAAAVLALLLLALHPVAIALSGPGATALFLSLKLPWYIWLGKLALLLLVVQVLASALRHRMRLKYERWRLLHNQAALIFGLGFVHSRLVGTDLQRTPMQILWWALLAIAAFAYGYHKYIAPAIARARAYRITDVKCETHNVWTLRMAATQNRKRFAYRPGQFHFITLWRARRHLPVEEHHFTISSSPTQAELSSTIKESGDFTATIGRTEPGDLVSVEGPFGRFSYVFRAGDMDLVFIAGGIGITPLMSMLRHMRDTQADITVLLLYANRTERDIVFRDELDEIAAAEHPNLRVIHVLSEAGDGWHGEAGHIDRDRITHLVGWGLRDRMYYVCGPPPMARSVLRALCDLGVPRSHIRYERFSL